LTLDKCCHPVVYSIGSMVDEVESLELVNCFVCDSTIFLSSDYAKVSYGNLERVVYDSYLKKHFTKHCKIYSKRGS